MNQLKKFGKIREMGVRGIVGGSVWAAHNFFPRASRLASK
jgi:hypothetical protein